MQKTSSYKKIIALATIVVMMATIIPANFSADGITKANAQTSGNPQGSGSPYANPQGNPQASQQISPQTNLQIQPSVPQDNLGQIIKGEIPKYGPGFGDNIQTEICGDNGCGDEGGLSEFRAQDNLGQVIKEEIPKYGPGFGDNIQTEICGDNGCGDEGGLGEFRGDPSSP